MEGALRLAEDLHPRHIIVLAAAHPETAASWQNLAALCLGDGQPEAAIDAARRAVEVFSTLEGTDGRDAAEALVALALTLASAGRTSEAMDALEDADTTLVARLGDDHPGTLVAGPQ